MTIIVQKPGRTRQQKDFHRNDSADGCVGFALCKLAIGFKRARGSLLCGAVLKPLQTNSDVEAPLARCAGSSEFAATAPC